VQNFSSKIVPKKEIFKIPTPIYQQLSDNYYDKIKICNNKNKKSYLVQTKENINHENDWEIFEKRYLKNADDLNDIIVIFSRLNFINFLL